jgi:hypothetical protein
MLGRWAKYATPQSMLPKRGETVSDPSSGNPNVALSVADTIANTPSGSSTTALSTGYGSPAPTFNLKPGTDPSLPAAVAALKAKLASQPHLVINISEVLSQIAVRAEEANAAMVEGAVEPGAWDNNVWGLGITKVKITLAKLERFAEIVAAGSALAAEHAAAVAADRADEDEEMTDTEHEEGDESSEMGGMDQAQWAAAQVQQLGGNLGIAGITGYSADWITNTPLPNDMFEGLDPAMWLDGTGDWGSIVMSSMGYL